MKLPKHDVFRSLFSAKAAGLHPNAIGFSGQHSLAVLLLFAQCRAHYW
jgi:hypothetical protein